MERPSARAKWMRSVAWTISGESGRGEVKRLKGELLDSVREIGVQRLRKDHRPRRASGKQFGGRPIHRLRSCPRRRAEIEQANRVRGDHPSL